MHFDVIISNPPYQLSDGGGGAGKSAAPIYHKFIEQAKKLKPQYMTMIIPSRWFSGGKGLDTFRRSMLNDREISTIVDYFDSKSCFPSGVDIPGGICYFLWENGANTDCNVINHLKDGRITSEIRKLNEFDIFIRNNNALSIVHKVANNEKGMLSDQVSSRRPFGLDSNTESDPNGDIILRNSKGLGKVNFNRITSGKELLKQFKVIVSKVSFEHAGVPDKDGTMRVLSVIQILPPYSACTESYLVAGAYSNEIEAANLATYLRTKFSRFLIMQMLASMNMSKSSYRFVPIQDFTSSSDIDWSKDVADIDRQLYAKYGLNEDEIAFIESMIKPMDIDGGKDE